MLKNQFTAAQLIDGKYHLFKAKEEEFRSFELFIGLPVVVKNNRILSNQTKGRITGFKVNASGTALCKVHWLEGAPPLMVKCESVESILPRKMWVLIQHRPSGNITENTTFSTGDGYWNAGRGVHGRRYFDYTAAVAQANTLARAYDSEVLIMRVDGLCNGSSVVAL